MEFLKPWLEAFRNDAPLWLSLALLVFLLRKIKVRRRRRDSDFQRDSAFAEEDAPDEPERRGKTPSDVRDAGERGEDLIAEILYETIEGNFALFRNVYVPNDDGGTSEADLVMVHEKGAFVFESKNYNGLISGSMDALNWAHVHPNRKRYLFYNPVRQNRKHIQALSRYLNIPPRRFYSYIVFSDRCRLDRVPADTRSVAITQTAQLAETLERKLSALPTLYDAEEVRRIAERLAPLTNVGEEVKAKHIADIRAALQSDVCPFCGAELAVRHGKYGDFWGCSSYPKCKFKRKMEE